LQSAPAEEVAMPFTTATSSEGWAPGEHLARVLREEQEAWDIALAAERAADAPDAERLTAELARIKAFLERELSVHLAKEEADLFPALARRGLAAEVAEAKRQHAELRRLGARLALDGSDPRGALSELARALKRHLRYEADFLYVDLRRAEAEEYRADIEAALADGAGG
jgi:hypothetical protein